MTPAAILFLTIQGVIFLFWAALAFRTLFRLRAIAVADTGRAFPGMRAQIAAFGVFVRGPEFRSARRRLGILTLAMIGLSALAPFVLGAPLR